MAVKTPITKKEQDDAYNPALLNSAENSDTPYKTAGIDQAESYANDPANASKNTQNAEENPQDTKSMNYTGSGDGSPAKANWQAVLKKRGPLAGIVAILLGGGTGLTFLFTPGLVAIHFVETLSDDLNDQLAAADIRTNHVFRTKFKKMTGAIGVCSSTVNIRCKFSSMNKYQINNFEKAGFTMNCGNKPCDRAVFNRLTSITDPNGNKINNPSQLMNRSSNDPVLRGALSRAFNPKYRMMSDAVANTVFGKFGGKVNRFKDTKRSELHKKLLSSAETEASKLGKLTKTEGKDEWVNEDGAVAEGVTTEDEANQHNATVDKLEANGGVGKFASKLGKGASVLGTADLGCSIYNVYRSISGGAKLIRAEALGKYATTINSTIHAAKASDDSVTPEQMEFIGKIITETDPRKEIVDPKSDENEVKMIPNPNYGKSATDSAGYKLSAHGDIPNLQPESLQYMVGGGMAGKFADYGSYFKQQPAGCDVIQHPITRIGSAGISLVLGVGSGGFTIAASLAASAAGAYVLAYIEGMMTDMLSGNVVSDQTKYTQAGDALHTGTGVVQGGIAKVGLMRPLTDDTIDPYMNTSQQVKNYQDEVNKIASKDTPFDIKNEHSFLGSFARSLIPYTTKLSSISSASVALPALVSSSVKNITPSTYAKASDPKRFQQCDDADYEKLRIAADVFCNVRYGMSEEELNMDTEEVLEWMIAQGHIDEETGEAKSEEYQEYIEDCGVSPYGIYTDDDGNVDKYIKCTVDGKSDMANDKTYNYFRVYSMDKRIIDSMDSEPVKQNTALPGASAASFVVGSYNILHAVHHADKSRSIGGCGKSSDDPICLQTRSERQVKIVTGGAGFPAFDIFGTQETSPQQLGKLKELLPGYGVSPTSGARMSNNEDGAVAVWWNKEKFTQFTEGKAPGLSNTTKNITNPWVGLKSSSGHEVYVMSIHYAINGYGGTPANIRKSSQLTMDWVKSKSKPDNTVIVMGDFNDQPKQQLSYCVYTQNGVMQHAADMAAGLDAKKNCGSKSSTGGIDHIYVTPTAGITASGWNRPKEVGIVGSSSDHAPVYVTLKLPGEESAGSGGPVSKDGWAWPLKANESKNGPCYGGTRRHAGLDINTDGSGAVYAMHDGVVVNITDGVTGGSPATGNHIMIKTATGVFYGYQHLLPGKMKVKMNDTVKAGQVIAIAGKTGNVQASSKAHLHITMAKTNTTGSYGNLGSTFDPLSVLKDVKPAGYNCY